MALTVAYIRLVSYSDHHILFEIPNEEVGCSWYAEGIYGWADHGSKSKTWDLMKSLKASVSSQCVFFGDFNELLHNSEKEGGCTHHARDIQAFQDCLNFCEFKDLGFCGSPFT